MIFLSKKQSTAASYTQNILNNQGTGNLRGFTHSTGGIFKDAFTLSMWVRPDAVVGTQFLYEVSGRIEITMSGASLSVTLRDGGNNDSYGGGGILSSGSVFTAATWIHLYIAADFANDTLVIQADGSNVAMATDVSSFSSISGNYSTSRENAFLTNVSNTLPFDGHVADMALIDSVVSNTLLYNGGTPPDPDAFATTPVFLMGGAMTADERAGNTAQGWNDLYNAGSGSDPAAGSGTFVDV